MPTTYDLTARAAGSLTPRPMSYTQTSPVLTNGDFSIHRNPTDEVLGTGVNEFTNWSFDFSDCEGCPSPEDLDWLKLTKARLTMTLEPKSTAISTDSVMIEGLTRIYTDKIRTLPVGQTATVELDLLDMGDQSYEPEDILRVFRDGDYGQIPMEYEEDAILGKAMLDLTLEKTP